MRARGEMYISDLVRLELPYPPMFYEALGCDPTSWDAAFFWRSGRFLWTDMGETGFGHAPGWRAFVNHSVIAERVADWAFGSESQEGAHFLLARVPEKDFYVGVVSLIDDVFRTSSDISRASTEAEVVGLLRTGQGPTEPANRSRAVSDMVGWLDRLDASTAT